MKRLALVLLTGVVVLSVLGWIYGGRSLSPPEPSVREEQPASVPEEQHKEDAQADHRAKEDSDRDPDYLHLPVWYAYKLGDKKARVGYWDVRKKTLYAWKGVLVPVAEIYNMDELNARAQPLDLTKIHVIEIDPPVFYLQRADDSFVPGYYERFHGGTMFYEWKGVTLTRRQIPDAAAKKRLLKKAAVNANRPIEPPQHRLRESKDWKKD